jgi:uncharacterized protein YoxC
MGKILAIAFLIIFAALAFGIVFIILKTDKGYTELIKEFEKALEKQNIDNLKNNENGN